MNLSRLDRIYVSDLLGDKGGSVEILARTCFSDHAPVILLIQEGQKQASLSLRVPDALQIDDVLAGSIEDLWQDL